MVRAPRPGPISITVSPARGETLEIIFETTASSTRKFCPSDFFAGVDPHIYIESRPRAHRRSTYRLLFVLFEKSGVLEYKHCNSFHPPVRAFYQCIISGTGDTMKRPSPNRPLLLMLCLLLSTFLAARRSRPELSRSGSDLGP